MAMSKNTTHQGCAVIPCQKRATLRYSGERGRECQLSGAGARTSISIFLSLGSKTKQSSKVWNGQLATNNRFVYY